ncbi:helix-turn-helix domain-containing protein [Chitinophagaceae bacterium MMS25-I14]
MAKAKTGINPAIGENIKSLRKFFDLTQEHLAEKVNKSRTWLSKVENGGKIHEDMLQVIATKLHLTVEQLENAEEVRKMLEGQATEYMTPQKLNDTLGKMGSDIADVKALLTTLVQQRNACLPPVQRMSARS